MKPADDSDPRVALVDWMTKAGNPFFAKAIANRIWAAFFGRGIVDPVDDFRLSNPASNPALLDALAQEVIKDKYDLKALMRTIMSSRIYQLSATPNEWNAGYAQLLPRLSSPSSAEVITDAVADVTGVPNSYEGMPPGSRAIRRGLTRSIPAPWTPSDGRTAAVIVPANATRARALFNRCTSRTRARFTRS
jgi:hypothetical protein